MRIWVLQFGFKTPACTLHPALLLCGLEQYVDFIPNGCPNLEEGIWGRYF